MSTTRIFAQRHDDCMYCKDRLKSQYSFSHGILLTFFPFGILNFFDMQSQLAQLHRMMILPYLYFEN